MAIFNEEPWKDYLWTQYNGIYWFTGVETEVATRNSSVPIVNQFLNNTISYAFSWQAGVYSHVFDIGVESSYCLFKNNSYSHIYSLDSGVMKMKVKGLSGSSTSYVVHNHTDERLEDVQNSAYRYFGQTGDVSAFFYNMYVLDSFGVTLDTTKYSSIVTNTLFSFTNTYNYVMVNSRITYTKNNPYWGVKPLKFDRNFEFYSRVRSRLTGYLNTDYDTFLGDTNDYGVVRLESVKNTKPLLFNTTLVTNDNGELVRLWTMLEDTLDLRQLDMENITKLTSFVMNTTFEHVCGNEVSAIFVDRTTVKVHTSKIKGCYSEFDAPLGSTVVLQNGARGVFNLTYFEDNESR